MAQVSVTIDNRKYRLACNEGEEARLEQLAGMVDEKINELRHAFGEIGDQRLVVMAALTFADQLAEARAAAETEREHAEGDANSGQGDRRHAGRARGANRGPGGAAFGRRRGMTQKAPPVRGSTPYSPSSQPFPPPEAPNEARVRSR